jgi:RNase P/RNase MRP subunit p30
MRRFIDLHLRRPERTEELELMLRTAADMGYAAVSVAEDPSNMIRAGKSTSDMGIDVVSRVDLRPRSDRDLTALLNRVRRRFEVVAVECGSKAVARQAAKDHRVDVLVFSASPSTRSKTWFDDHEAALAAESNCAYEINVADLLLQGPFAVAKLLFTIGREIENARRHRIPIVASSGADSRMLMREPRGLAALLDLVDVEERAGLDMISSNPQRIVDGNRAKLSSSYVSPGVRRAE